MVIILQQTMDNGRRFVSTVVEEESSLNSNFSVGSSSHNSISERSAIYKQRIDSLFGRHTRLNPFKPAALEPFCIRIENSRLQQQQHQHQQYNGIVGGGSRESESRARSSSSVATSTTTTQQQQTTVSSVRFHHHRSTKTHHQGSSFLSPCRKSSPSTSCSTTVQFSTDNHNSSKNASSSHPTVTIEETDFSTTDDEDEEDDDVNGDYEKIGHGVGSTNGSFHTDSLNTRPSPGNNKLFSDNGNHIAKENNTLWLPTGASHVSSVRLNCESGDSNDDGFPQHHKVTTTMSSNSSGSNQSEMSGGGGGGNSNKTIGESHMWHNGNFTDFHSNPEERQYGIVRAMSGGILKFTVDYLGCVPVDGTTTALQDLQAPLRSLYMNYLSGTNVMGGKLAITTDGLRFEAPKLRLVNPFATIAVWAAIKFVARGGESNNNHNNISECAFMPLISDPEGQDKSRLFSKMSSELHKAYTNCVNNNKQNFRNPPIFACVMREASFSLDCHAFACKCAEDAIVIAANLYQSLVDKMRAGNKEGESGYGSLTRNSPATTQSSPNQNPHINLHHRSSSSSVSSQGESPVDLIGVGNSSNSSSSSNSPRCHDTTQELCRVNCPKKPQQQQLVHDLNHRTAFSDSESVVPVRPPRRKKKSLDNGNTSSSSSNGNLKRYNSDDSVMVKPPHRRRSFKANTPHYTKAKKRVQITTPDEAATTSSDSVNECIDHVLDRVIHPGGMSFNDLKPPYQELILKIALTLTQDQLYQKSKQAMKKHHQQVNFRKKPSKTPPAGNTSDDNSQFLNNLLKSFSKITSSSKSAGAANKRKLGKMSSNFKNKVGYPTKVILKKPGMMPGKDNEDPFLSYCSGCACDNCSDKCYCSLPSKHNIKTIGLPPPPPPPSSNTPSSGKSSCSPPSRNGHNHLGLNGPSKGQKVMLMGDNKEAKKTCGYDTDSCAESEKCYCSLQRVKSNGLKIYNINLDTETSDTDTNSYDFEPFNDKSARDSSNKNTNNNAKGAKTRPVEILSYHPAKKVTYNLSPSSSASSSTAAHVQTTNAVVHFEHKQQQQQSKPKNSSGSVTAQAGGNNNNNCKLTSRNHSLVSSSYLHSTMDEKLSSCESKKGVTQRNKVLLITGSSNPSTRLMYKDNYYQDGKKSRIDHRTNLMDITEDEDVSNEEEDDEDDDDDDDNEDNSYRHHRLGSSNDDEMAPDRILSMKKTAEIAAMFTDLHLDQTTNIVPEHNNNSNNSSSFEDSSQTQDDSNGSVDFEASLGYLP